MKHHCKRNYQNQKNIESHFKPDHTRLNMPAESKNIQIYIKSLKEIPSTNGKQ